MLLNDALKIVTYITFVKGGLYLASNLSGCLQKNLKYGLWYKTLDHLLVISFLPFSTSQEKKMNCFSNVSAHSCPNSFGVTQGQMTGTKYQTSWHGFTCTVKIKTNSALKGLALLRPQSIFAFTWCYWRQINYLESLKFTTAGTETAQLGNKEESAHSEDLPLF